MEIVISTIVNKIRIKKFVQWNQNFHISFKVDLASNSRQKATNMPFHHEHRYPVIKQEQPLVVILLQKFCNKSVSRGDATFG